MRVVITGAEGQLGGELCRQFGAEAIGIDLNALDLAQLEAIEPTLDRLRPDIIINCAAYTNVDRAEAEPEKCFRVNAEAVDVIAGFCEKKNRPLVQISTDYVFCGSSPGRPWREDDEPRPRGVYASSKWVGERNALKHPRSIVVRTCGLYARRALEQHRNFVRAILRKAEDGQVLRVVADQCCCPTYVPHAARAIEFLSRMAILQAAAAGIYHVVNTGGVSWYEFAQTVLATAGMKTVVEPISTEEYAAAAPRPGYSVLDVGKYHRLGGPVMPPWSEAVRQYFSDCEKRRAYEENAI